MGTCLRGSNLIFKAKQIHRVQLVSCVSCSQLQSASKDTYPKISAPKKIERSPTALLEALEETIGHECRSYGKFTIDDPASYYPHNRKAAIMLAKASGRKTAKMMAKMYSPLFEGTPTHVPVEPPVEGYNITVAKGNEENLEEAVTEQIELRDACEVFDLCKKMIPEGNAVSAPTAEQLIHFLSFYHQRDYTATEPEEIELLDIFKPEKDRQLDGILRDLFLAYEGEKSPELYNSYIRRFITPGCELQKQECLQIYETMRKSQVPLECKTYHYLLSHPEVFYDKSLQSSAKAIQQILNDMKKAGYHPTVETFNMALMGLDSTVRSKKTSENVEYGLKLIADIKNLGIEPTLDTWSIFMLLFDTPVYGKGPVSGVMRVMNNVMDHIEGRKFENVGPEGRKFLMRAMNIALLHQDLEFAYRIDNFYKTGQNYKLLDDYQQRLYRMMLFILAVHNESDLVRTVSLYTALQPMDEVFSYKCLRKFITDLTVTKSYKFIPELLPSFYVANFCLEEITSFLSKEKQPPLVQARLNDFVEIKLQGLTNRASRQMYKLQVLENLMVIALNGENINLAWKIFTFITGKRKELFGVVKRIQPYTGLLDQYIAADDLGKCAEVMKFLVKEVPKDVIQSFGEKIFVNVPMNELERQQLNRILDRGTGKKIKFQ
ncbi:pentatricopeptide repeat-containing protein 3, mitochondrial-like [Ostrea edulis]|uniref:pentatricopeptide repeat-containing protein 3, mitochondrial-like n=1 Tax=Ostrea edulis TaxID=37623 RepID=UPI0024AEA275|nr:pentatricopeptide repeat-containing protein 3, mitochondrial-like [Ostrea edulis]